MQSVGIKGFGRYEVGQESYQGGGLLGLSLALARLWESMRCLTVVATLFLLSLKIYRIGARHRCMLKWRRMWMVMYS